MHHVIDVSGEVDVYNALTRLVGFLPIMSTELEAIESIAAKESPASGPRAADSFTAEAISRE